MKRVYPFARIFIGSWYRMWLRRMEGLENLPKPPFIIASNHASYYETILFHCTIALKLKTKIHALVNGNYWKYLIPRTVLNTTEHIPIDVSKTKDSKKNNEKALKKAAQYLKKKDIILIFPEGHRSKDGKLQKAKTGAARLALMSKAPVVPIGVIGSEKVMPRGSILPRFVRCDVKIGKPMHFKGKKTKSHLKHITRNIMTEIGKLIGQKYKH